MKNHLHTRIAALRRDRGEQQAELADAVGCHRSMISAIETGSKKPGRELLFKIARHYHVSVDWLETGQSGDPLLEEIFALLRAAGPEEIEAVRAVLKLSAKRR